MGEFFLGMGLGTALGALAMTFIIDWRLADAQHRLDSDHENWPEDL